MRSAVTSSCKPVSLRCSAESSSTCFGLPAPRWLSVGATLAAVAEHGYQELHARGRPRKGDPCSIAARRACERQAALRERDEQGENQRKMAEFWNHDR